MNKPLDLTLTLLDPNARVRLVNQSLLPELKRPNFLIRFIRWIKGEYNQVKICGKIHDLALQYLKNPHQESLKLRTLKTNYERFIGRVKNQKRFPLSIHEKTIEQIATALEALKIQPQQPKPAPKPLANPLPVPARAPVKKAVPHPLTNAKPQVRLKKIREVSPLETNWKAITENLNAPLNSIADLPFAAKLSTAESLFQWICEGIEPKPAFCLPSGKTDAQTLERLLHILGFSSPQTCIQIGLEPTEEAFNLWISNKRDQWIALATSLGCIKADLKKLKQEWIEACEEESYEDIQNDSLILFASVEFLPLMMNADNWIHLVFGDKEPLVSWKDPNTRFKRHPEQSVFAQNQMKILGLQTIDDFVKKQILPTTKSLKHYLKAHEQECQKLVMEYLERQNYVKN